MPRAQQINEHSKEASNTSMEELLDTYHRGMSDLVWPLRAFPIRPEHMRAKRVKGKQTALVHRLGEPGDVHSSSVLIRQLPPLALNLPYQVSRCCLHMRNCPRVAQPVGSLALIGSWTTLVGPTRTSSDGSWLSGLGASTRPGDADDESRTAPIDLRRVSALVVV